MTEKTDEKTRPRRSSGERAPRPARSPPAPVPASERERHETRKDTARGLARDDEPLE